MSPDGNIGDTMVGNQGATWTWGKDGWDTDAFDANEVTVYGFLDANNSNPIIAVNLVDIPSGLIEGEFIHSLKLRLVENGFSDNVQVKPSKNIGYGISDQLARLWYGTEVANLTVRNFNPLRDARRKSAGGYSVPNSNSATVYSGLGPRLASSLSNVKIYLYVNASMHELGHGLFGFRHDSNGHTDYSEWIMDYRSVYKPGTNFSPSQIQTIKSSSWGN